MQASDDLRSQPATTVKAVRLENFENPDWQNFLNRRVLLRYPGARFVSRQPYVVTVELRAGGTWSAEDEAFFAAMKQEGFFRRWEPLAELPPAPKSNEVRYRDIGYRVGSGERLTQAQAEALFSQLHDLEERAVSAEERLREWLVRAERAEEHAAATAQTYNALITMLGEVLQVKVASETGLSDAWVAEDASSGRVLARAEEDLAEVYRAVLTLRLASQK